jgi:NitT/TauT family transport system substrate-binding protein
MRRHPAKSLGLIASSLCALGAFLAPAGPASAGPASAGPASAGPASAGPASAGLPETLGPNDASLIAASRCAANRAAGTITYLTGFSWEASVGILDPLAAEALGYYADLCLRVRFEPGTGDPTTTGQLAAAGKATITELGSPSDAIQDAAGTPSIPIDAVATYGNSTIDTLLTKRSVTSLRQLDGKKIGYKGAMPPDISAMLEKAGVKLSTLHEVEVGYDPTVLPRGQVQALTGYKSNEPVQLQDDGYKVREWDPDNYGIKGAFNVLDVNRSWADAHQAALEDFLRATFKAFDFCLSHAATCVGDAAKYEAGYNVHQNIQRWKIESAIVEKSLLPRHGVGYEDQAQWAPGYQLLRRFHFIKGTVDIGHLINPSYVNAIYRGRTLIWP